jgi:DNA-binding beta-propeller fold protein YncE/mono/diheme cytochrome c family protein
MMTQRRLATLSLIVCSLAGLAWLLPFTRQASAETEAVSSPAGAVAQAIDRSPVDLVISPDGSWLITANQTSDTLSLVRIADGRILDEQPCSRRPVAVALTHDGRRALVTTSHGGELLIFDVADERLISAGKVRLGFEPHGVAVSPDNRLAYVALTGANQIAVVDLAELKPVAEIAVGQWPRYLCLTADGSRLAVGCSGEGGITVVDTAKREKLFSSKFVGLNIGHLAASQDGHYAYFPWMVYADRPITVRNIKEGWVLGNRLARVRLDEPARREAIALDVRGAAVADPHGMAISPDQNWLAMTASGTHELVLLRIGALDLRTDGPGDHIRPELAADTNSFIRIPLGGRPMAVRFDASGTRALVANYLTSSVQIVDVQARSIEREIPLGSAPEPSLARRGEAIFFDANRSVDGWYSCHSCHYDGHTNAVTMDTRNDGSDNTFKMVLSLRNIQHTGPWFWHGWQKDLSSAVARSLVETMQGPKPTDEDVRELLAYFSTLEPAPNSRRAPDGSFSEAAQRGQKIFASADANCAACHSGPYFTDGQIHDVGLGSAYDKYEGYNTPSLLGIANRVGYLHHGRAKSLDELLSDLHSPAKVSGTRELTDQERADLVAYLLEL